MGGPLSASIMVLRMIQTKKLSRGAIWQVLEDWYHTDFVLWRVHNSFFFFIFFPWLGLGGRILGPKWSPKVFYNSWALYKTLPPVEYFPNGQQNLFGNLLGPFKYYAIGRGGGAVCQNIITY